MGKVQYRYHVELIVPIRSIERHETIYGDAEADHRTYRCKTEAEARVWALKLSERWLYPARISTLKTGEGPDTLSKIFGCAVWWWTECGIVGSLLAEQLHAEFTKRFGQTRFRYDKLSQKYADRGEYRGKRAQLVHKQYTAAQRRDQERYVAAVRAARTARQEVTA